MPTAVLILLNALYSVQACHKKLSRKGNDNLWYKVHLNIQYPVGSDFPCLSTEFLTPTQAHCHNLPVVLASREYSMGMVTGGSELHFCNYWDYQILAKNMKADFRLCLGRKFWHLTKLQCMSIAHFPFYCYRRFQCLMA